MTLKTKPKAIFFDMDGTFCDSIHAVYQSLSTLLETHDRTLPPKHNFRGQMDKRKQRDDCLGFKDQPESDPRVDSLQKQLLHIYLENMAAQTVLFPGIEPVLTHIKQQNIAWGIVTNRPEFLMLPAVKKFDLEKQTSCLVYGDTLTTCKPEPDMLFHACKLTKIQPNQAWYIGDTEGDMIAAQRAGMPFVFAEYGYYVLSPEVAEIKYDERISKPEDLIPLLQQTLNTANIS